MATWDLLLRRAKRVSTVSPFLVLVALAALASFMFTLAPALGGAQQHADDAQQPGFILKQNVHLVLVPVTVKDRNDALVDDLTQDDFTIFEDGRRRRPIQYFSSDTTPLSAVVLIDTGMPAVSVDAVRNGLRNLAQFFAPDDEEAVILFDNTIRPLGDFSNTSEAVFAAAAAGLPQGTGSGASILGGPLGGPLNTPGVINGVPGTAPSPAPHVGKRIDDALFAAVQQLRTRPLGRRRVVVILSDGANGSDNQVRRGEVLEALAATQVTVYALSFGSGWVTPRLDLLARFARDSGGDIAYIQRHGGVDRAFSELTNEARNSYVLGFAPLSADARFHDIRVRVRGRGLHLIARNRFLSIPTR